MYACGIVSCQSTGSLVLLVAIVVAIALVTAIAGYAIARFVRSDNVKNDNFEQVEGHTPRDDIVLEVVEPEICSTEVGVARVPAPAPTPAVNAEGPVTEKDLPPEILSLLRDIFARYDIDSSGTLNTADEMRQVCVNLRFYHPELVKDMEIATLHAVADAAAISCENPLGFEDFSLWFKANLYKPPA